MLELTAPECRYFAQECRRLANTAITVEERIYLREREAAWIHLAEEAEQRERQASIQLASSHSRETPGCRMSHRGRVACSARP